MLFDCSCMNHTVWNSLIYINIDRTINLTLRRYLRRDLNENGKKTPQDGAASVKVWSMFINTVYVEPQKDYSDRDDDDRLPSLEVLPRIDTQFWLLNSLYYYLIDIYCNIWRYLIKGRELKPNMIFTCVVMSGVHSMSK